MQAFDSFKFSAPEKRSCGTCGGGQTAAVLADEADAAALGLISGAPTTAPPGTLQISAPVSIDPGPLQRQVHPDLCNLGLFSSGLLVQVELRVDGETRDSTTSCLARNSLFDIEALLSETGTREIEIVALGGNSGVVFGSETVTVQIEEDADRGGDIGDPGTGGGGGGPRTIVERLEDLAVPAVGGAVAFLVLILLLQVAV